MEFGNLTEPSEIKQYLLNVLSRTGNTTKENNFLYHYTNVFAIEAIIKSGYIWLGSTANMNDFLEGEIIRASGSTNNLFITCFSCAEENLAMYKMYAPSPDGVMLKISFADAEKIANHTKARIVCDNNLTEEDIDVELNWAAVCYKDLHTNLLRTGNEENNLLCNPLVIPELAGLVKLYGWEYEKEVRLCGVTNKSLKDYEKLAIKIPDDVTIEIVVGPGFDRKKHLSQLTLFKQKDITVKNSEYDYFVDMGLSVNPLETKEVMSYKTKIEELERENQRLHDILDYEGIEYDESRDSVVDESDNNEFEPKDGYHQFKDSKGNIIKEGNFKDFHQIDGVEYNWILRVVKNNGCDYPIHNAMEVDAEDVPVAPEDLAIESCRYSPMEQYKGYFILLSSREFIIEDGLEFYYVVDKHLRFDGDQIIPKYSHFRRLEDFLAEKEPEELRYIKTGRRKYDEADVAEFDFSE